MQVLMSQAALARVADRLATAGDGIDVITQSPDGGLHRQGATLDPADVDPEVFWLSLDLFRTPQLPAFLGEMMRGQTGRWAQIFAAGLDHPVFNHLMAKGLRLTKSSAQSDSIAEYVMVHALSLIHPLATYAQAQAAHEWRFVNYREVASTRWLMVGYGAIGQAIAQRLHPFRAPLTVVRRQPGAEPLAERVCALTDLPMLLPGADVVVLACALNDETRGLADEAFFRVLKPGAILINIGRGGLVDEAALRAGLDRHQPAHAVLDVFETEPLPADAWFWDHPKVRVTAHCAGAGDGVMARGDDLFLDNLKRYLAGQPLRNEAHRSEVGLAG